jgi:hypothetical protein
MIQSDLLLNVSFNRGDASDRSWANRTPTVGAGASIASRYADFNGTSTAVVSYPNSGALETFPLTASAWIFIDTYTGYRSIIGKSNQSGAILGWRLTYAPGVSRGLNFLHSTNISNLRQNWTTTASLAAGAWYHVAASVSAINQQAILYINGSSMSVTNSSVGTVTTISTSEPVRICGLGGADGGWSYHDGRVDDVRIYNRVLTAAEIAGIYASGRD